MHIEHLALWVRHLEPMRVFYETYFGATANDKYVNATKGFSSYFLRFPDGGASLELMHRLDVKDLPGNGAAQRMGLTHMAFSVGSEATVNVLTERLRLDGYSIVGRTPPNGRWLLRKCSAGPGK